ncbi:MAG TPA: GNAT family N-acetyltransferase, partial [Gaiellaceae bacterium]|nr:GNAT family N-acetyltransferase [Gaiellaceae bacterium]
MIVRPARPEDAPVVAAVFASLEEALLGSSTFDVEDVRGWWQTVDVERQTWLVEEDGTLLAAAGCQVLGELASSLGAVRPSAQGRGLGARLLELVEGRAAADGASRLQAWALAADDRATGLFRARGYREVRRFWGMAIELDRDLPEPEAPVEAVREEDAPVVHAALEEAFEDHWEPHPEPFEAWWARQRAKPAFDLTLWFVIRQDGEVAGAVRNEVRSTGGYVAALGVRRAYRGR